MAIEFWSCTPKLWHAEPCLNLARRPGRLAAHDPGLPTRRGTVPGCPGRRRQLATVEDVQAALEAMRSKEDGSAVRPATVNTYVAAVKSFLGFAHRVGFTRCNAGRSSTSRRRRAKLHTGS